MDNVRTFIAIPSANATIQIPGNGKGSSLTLVISSLTVATSTGNAITNPKIVTLSALTSLAVGQLIIMSGGLWGTIVGFNVTGTAPGANCIEVDEWRGGSVDHKRKPAVSETTRVFPTGSILAKCNGVRLWSVNVIDNSAQTLSLYDVGATALFTTLSALSLDSFRLPSPFAYSTSGASAGFLIVFEVR